MKNESEVKIFTQKLKNSQQNFHKKYKRKFFKQTV